MTTSRYSKELTTSALQFLKIIKKMISSSYVMYVNNNLFTQCNISYMLFNFIDKSIARLEETLRIILRGDSWIILIDTWPFFLKL